MTRIIAGAARSLTLVTPKGQATRPTSDRVREALFAVLDARGILDDAAVLDLYAGSGALGLEALSRGALSVDLVDSAGSAIAAARENAIRVTRATQVDASAAHAVKATVAAFLARSTSTYSLVFLDPPYAVADEVISTNVADLAPRLAPGAIVIVERSSRSEEPAWPLGFAAQPTRRYGETSVHMAEWIGDDAGQGSEPRHESNSEHEPCAASEPSSAASPSGELNPSTGTAHNPNTNPNPEGAA